MATATLQVFDVVWADIPKPDPRDTSPSIVLPLGGLWRPGDWRIVCLGGPFNPETSSTAATLTYNNASTYFGMPAPAGWQVIYYCPQVGGTIAPMAVAHKLAAGDNDAEYSLTIPAAAGYYGGGLTLTKPWQANTKPALFAFTVRGADPSSTPSAYWAGVPSTTGTGDTDPTTSTPYVTYSYAARSLSAGALPGAELLVYGYLASIATPSGWQDMWDNDFCGDHAIRPAGAASSQMLLGRNYNSGSSTGALLVRVEDNPTTLFPDPANGQDHGMTSQSIQGQYFIYFKRATDVTVTGDAAPQETDSAFDATVTVGPETTVIGDAAPMEIDRAYDGATPLYGFTVQDPYILDGNPVVWSKMRWREVFIPVGGSARVWTSLDWGDTWQQATNGGPIVGLKAGNTTVDAVLVKVVYTRAAESDPSPRIANLEPIIVVDDGRDEVHPMGVFLIRDTDVELVAAEGSSSAGGGSNAGVAGTGGGQKGGAQSILLKAVDLSWAISQNPWTEAFYIEAGTPYEDAVKAMVRDRLPGFDKFNIATTNQVTPTLIFGTTPNGDPMKDIKELMLLGVGFDAYFAPDGTFTSLPVSDPAVGTPTFRITGADGDMPVISAARKRLSSREFKNWIIVEGEAVSPVTGQEIVAVHAEAKDEQSIARFGPRSRTVVSQAITDQEQGQLAADALLVKLNGTTVVLEVTIPPNCTLEPGDIGEVDLPDLKVTGNFVLQSTDTPFSQARGQRLVLWQLAGND